MIIMIEKISHPKDICIHNLTGNKKEDKKPELLDSYLLMRSNLSALSNKEDIKKGD
jgi:hypothetical protein